MQADLKTRAFLLSSWEVLFSLFVCLFFLKMNKITFYKLVTFRKTNSPATQMAGVCFRAIRKRNSTAALSALAGKKKKKKNKVAVAVQLDVL